MKIVHRKEFFLTRGIGVNIILRASRDGLYDRHAIFDILRVLPSSSPESCRGRTEEGAGGIFVNPYRYMAVI